jgi:Competence protein CoiA-like family
MAKSIILYSSALDTLGSIVNASQAVRGEKYFCPLCHCVMSLKKGSQRRPHFSHKVNSSNCTSEGVLHFSFKSLLSKRIDESIKHNIPIPLSWCCEICSETHSGNLIRKVKTVKLEYDMNVARPDIALLDEQGEILAAIEIVVTHHPEKKVQAFYSSKNIALVQFILSSDDVNSGKYVCLIE